MLKFIKHNMETIIGIEIFPLISFIIFFSFFVGLIIYVIALSKRHVADMSAMPLQSEESTTSTPKNDLL